MIRNSPDPYDAELVIKARLHLGFSTLDALVCRGATWRVKESTLDSQLLELDRKPAQRTLHDR